VPHASAAAERKVLYWYDPMSPTQKFDKPGKSPYMDMDLVPKYADEDADSTGLSISAPRPCRRWACARPWWCNGHRPDVDVVGNVLLNDRDVSIVQARSAGFVERVYARAPGDVIGARRRWRTCCCPNGWRRSASSWRCVRSRMNR
jgi:Cu(I)/Ag(I) efflux system membrane fusion protein